MKIGDKIYVCGYVDEIRKGTVIIRNSGGYFGTIPSEIICGEFLNRKMGKWLRSGNELFPFECDQCSETNERTTPWCPHCGCKMEGEQP